MIISEFMTDKFIEKMWRELTDIPVEEDEDGRLCLVNDWFAFDRGTDVEEIWGWFDERYSKGVGWLSENVR